MFEGIARSDHGRLARAALWGVAVLRVLLLAVKLGCVLVILSGVCVMIVAVVLWIVTYVLG